jgi:hypothetical protein
MWTWLIFRAMHKGVLPSISGTSRSTPRFTRDLTTPKLPSYHALCSNVYARLYWEFRSISPEKCWITSAAVILPFSLFYAPYHSARNEPIMASPICPLRHTGSGATVYLNQSKLSSSKFERLLNVVGRYVKWLFWILSVVKLRHFISSNGIFRT